MANETCPSPLDEDELVENHVYKPMVNCRAQITQILQGGQVEEEHQSDYKRKLDCKFNLYNNQRVTELAEEEDKQSDDEVSLVESEDFAITMDSENIQKGFQSIEEVQTQRLIEAQ